LVELEQALQLVQVLVLQLVREQVLLLVVQQEQAWEEWEAYRQAVAQRAAVREQDAVVQECGRVHEQQVAVEVAQQ
jgi:hypothetical protein